MSRTRRALTASAAAITLLLVPTAAARADTAIVERQPWYEEIHNPCNNDTVSLTATVVVSTKITSTADKLTLDQRVSFENVSTKSEMGLTYKYTAGISDTFRLTVKRGQEKIRSFHSSVLRLKPLNAKTGELRVVVRTGFDVDTATGKSRVIADSYKADCR